MNQKDYKEIAKRINYIWFPNGISKDMIRLIKLNLSNNLADYFEQEEQIARHPECECSKDDEFNKQQFRKACGVEE